MERSNANASAQPCQDVGPLLWEDLTERIDWPWLQACSAPSLHTATQRSFLA